MPIPGVSDQFSHNSLQGDPYEYGPRRDGIPRRARTRNGVLARALINRRQDWALSGSLGTPSAIRSQTAP